MGLWRSMRQVGLVRVYWIKGFGPGGDEWINWVQGLVCWVVGFFSLIIFELTREWCGNWVGVLSVEYWAL